MSGDFLRTVLAEKAAELDTRNPGRVDQIHQRVRVRRRRHGVAAGLGLAAVVTAVTVVFALGQSERAEGPVGEPTPSPSSPSESVTEAAVTSLTPRQVVTDEEAVLLEGGVSLGDPDVRVSRWKTVCDACPVPEGARSKPEFMALALTDDGYRSTRYVPDPVGYETELLIHSPTDGLFLLNDFGNGREWLVSLDGTVTTVDRVDTPLQPADPRLWFRCTSDVIGTPASWCALDPDTARSYRWPTASERGNGKMEWRPGTDGTPWGFDFRRDSGPVAWWEGSDGTKHTRPMASHPLGNIGVVQLSTEGPAYWSARNGAEVLELLLVPDPDGRGEVVTRPAPQGLDEADGASLALAQTPGGGLLAWSDWPRMMVWRADDLTQAEFHLVFQAEAALPGSSPMTVFDGRIHVNGLTSVDDGRSWSETSTWR